MRVLRNIILQLLLLLFISPALAGPVYRWIDAGGITHFSETPPVDTAATVQVLELPPPPPYNPDDDYYSVANQAARMEAARLERDRVHAEQLRAEAALRQAQAAAEPVQPPAPAEPVTIPVYTYRHFRYPGYGSPPRVEPRHHRHSRRPLPPGAAPRPFDPRFNQPDRWLRSQ